jgi:hypothetical protein
VKITEWTPVAVMRIGRPRLRWADDVRVDVGKTKIQNWSKMAVVEKHGKKTVEQARTHKGLVVPRE